MLWLPFAGSGLRHSHKYSGGIAKLFSPVGLAIGLEQSLPQQSAPTGRKNLLRAPPYPQLTRPADGWF